MILYRPVGVKELRLIEEAGYTSFPPRLFHQPIFYPVLNDAYAIQIARDWNCTDPASGYAGFVTRFEIPDEYASQFPIQVVGGRTHQELWVPAEQLNELNQQIVEKIEVIHSFYGKNYSREAE